MNRNLKALGLALVAVFAMTAVLASAAQAISVTTGVSPAWLTGEVIEHPNIGKVETFILAGKQDVACEEVKSTATVTNGATSITVVPTFDKCDAVIGVEHHKVTVTMNDCDFLLHGGETATPGSTTFKNILVDLVCPEGKQVEIHVYKNATDEVSEGELCTYKVAPFNNKGNSETHNVAGSPNDITITSTVEGIETTRTGSLLCGSTPTTGKFTGSTTVKAFKDEGGSISNGTVSELVEGAQTSLTISD